MCQFELLCLLFFFVKQKTAYEMRTSDLEFRGVLFRSAAAVAGLSIAYPLWGWRQLAITQAYMCSELEGFEAEPPLLPDLSAASKPVGIASAIEMLRSAISHAREMRQFVSDRMEQRSEEHTSELQSLMRISYAALRLKK